MSDPSDMTDWMPGQPAPWLAGYGPPPVATTPPAPDQPVQDPGIGLGGVPVPPPAASSPAGPPPESPPGAPTWLQQLTPSFLQQPQAPLADAVSGAAPAPPAAPDAISGPGESGAAPRNPTQDLAQIASDPDAPVTARMDARQKLPPDVRANIVNNADPKQLAVLSTSAMAPEELATIAVRHQQAQLHEESVRRLALAQQADQEARRSFEAYQAALQQSNASTAQLADEADALSKQKIDPKEHGVGNFVASVLTGAFGGAMMQANGGRNLGLEQLDKRTQERIDAQKADLANQWQGVKFKQNLIGEQVQRSGDLYRAQEAYRISTYDRATAELQTQMQDYDPQGTTALRAAGAVQQIQAQRAQALQAFQQQDFKNRLDAAKVQMDAAKAAQDAADKKIDQQQKQQEIGLKGWEIASANKRSDAELAEKQKEREDKQHEQDLGREVGGTPVATTDAGGKVVGYQQDVIRNRDGSVWKAATPAEGEKVRTGKAAVDQFVKAVDALRAIRTRSGWTSDTVKSDDWQAAHAEFAKALDGLKETQGITRFSEEDKKLFEEMLGKLEDPTRVNGILPGLDEARKIVIRDFNSTLNAHPGADVDYKVPDPLAGGPAKASPAEERLSNMLDWHTNQYGYGASDDAAANYYHSLTLTPEQLAAKVAQDQRGYSDEQKAYADYLAADTAKGDEFAHQQLQALAAKASSPGLQHYAAGLLFATRMEKP